MNRNDRIALLLIAGLLSTPALIALIFALTEKSHKTSGGGAIILAPRTGDEVGQDFAVAGTHGTSGVSVDVDVSGPYTGSGVCTSSPDWNVSFNAGGNTGGHTATATPSGGLGGVAFKIVGSQELSLGLPSVAVTLGGNEVTIFGRHNHAAAPPAITVRLFRPDGAPVATVTATDRGAGNWDALFTAVASGTYAAQASMTIMGKTTTCSQVVRVP